MCAWAVGGWESETLEYTLKILQKGTENGATTPTVQRHKEMFGGAKLNFGPCFDTK